MRKLLSIAIILSLISPSFGAYRKSRLYGQTMPSYGATVDWGNSISYGLLGWWLFNNGAGPNTYDIGPNNLTGVFSSTNIIWTTGKFGKALDFNGTGIYVEAPVQKPKPTRITVGGWYYIVAVNGDYQRIIGTDTDPIGTWAGFRLDTSAGTPRFFVGINTGSSGGITSSTTFSTKKWYHVVGTYDGATLQIYINGKLDTTGSLSGTLTWAGSFGTVTKLRFGEQLFGGESKLSNIFIYGRVLSGSEIRSLYEMPFNGLAQPRMFFSQPAAPPVAATTAPNLLIRNGLMIFKN